MACSIRRITAAIALALSACSAGAQPCDPPPNDNCAGAEPIVFSELPLVIEGRLGCDNFMVDRPYFDVFYRYDCTRTGDYRLDMCGSLGDTYMRVYSGGCGFFPAQSWVEDDDSCQSGGNQVDPMIATRLFEGTSYWIEVGSWRTAPQFPPNANDPFVLRIDYEGICAADLDADGSVGILDVNRFVTLLQEGDLSIDFHSDGVINFFDLSRFLTMFETSCASVPGP